MILSKIPLMDTTSFLQMSPTLSYDTTSSPRFPFKISFFPYGREKSHEFPIHGSVVSLAVCTLCWNGQECFHSHKFQGNVDGNQTTNLYYHGNSFSLAQELGIPLNQRIENGKDGKKL